MLLVSNIGPEGSIPMIASNTAFVYQDKNHDKCIGSLRYDIFYEVKQRFRDLKCIDLLSVPSPLLPPGQVWCPLVGICGSLFSSASQALDNPAMPHTCAPRP